MSRWSAERGGAQLRRVVSVLGVTVGLALTGCADDGPASDRALDGELSTPEDATGTSGTFDDIPTPEGSSEISERTERDGAIVQSFTLSESSPEDAMEFFAQTLPDDGWTLLEEPESTGTDSIAGSWARDGRRLDVSALLAQGVDGELTQFSLVLLPSLEDAGSIEGG